MDLSIVIPAYNEAHRIAETLDKVSGYFDSTGMEYEIIVADDGSGDNTAIAVSTWAETTGRTMARTITIPHKGKGAAVAAGVMAAEGNRILMSDADVSTPFTEWPKLKEELDRGAQIAIGSRQAPGAKVERFQPFFRQRLGKFFGWIARKIFPLEVRDSQCGFKAFDGKTAKSLFSDIRTSGYCFDVEVLLLAKRRGVEVSEVPVRWINDPDSRVNIWKDWLQVIKELWVIRDEMKKARKEGD